MKKLFDVVLFLRELVRYSGFSILGIGIWWAGYLFCLYAAHWGYQTAVLLAYPPYWVGSFLLLKYGAFEDPVKGRMFEQSWKYILLMLQNVVLTWLGVRFLVEVAGLGMLMSPLIIEIVLGIENYFICRIIFRNPEAGTR